MDELDSDDEIFDLGLQNSDSDQLPVEDEPEEEDYSEEEDLESNPTSTRAISPPKGRFAKPDDLTQDILSDASNSEAEVENSSDEEETWAANTYHASRRAPGEPDSEDDEALDMEAEEAKRLQKKFKTTLAGDDYGFGDGVEEEGEIELVREKSRLGGRLEEAMKAEVEIGVNYKNEEEAIAFLLKKQPETLALLDDFAETAERMENVEKALAIVRLGENGKEHPALAIMELEHRSYSSLTLMRFSDDSHPTAEALSTYLPTLAFYFSLLLTATPPPHLVTKVLARITSLRSALATMEELDLTAGNIDDSDSEGSDTNDARLFASNNGLDEEMDEFSEEEYGSEEEEEITDSMLGGLEDEELEELMKDMAEDDDADALIARVKNVQRMKLGLPPLEVESESEMEEEITLPKPSKNKNKAKAAKRIAAREAAGGIKSSVLNLAPLLPPIRKVIASSSRVNEVEDDYLDPTALSLTDLTDKAQRKHTLRFHVSQVHQKSVKRGSTGTEFGGDDDLPRKTKEAARREVLQKQQHGGQKSGEDLDGMDWDESDKKDAAAVDGEDYYDLVKRATKEKKVAKKVEYDDAVSAQK